MDVSGRVAANRRWGEQAVRADDFIARLGGDEFAVFMCDVPSARVALERAQRFCDSVRMTFSGRRISCSAGIALYPVHGTHFCALYQRADEALYEAKKRGKNQQVLSGASPVRGCEVVRGR